MVMVATGVPGAFWLVALPQETMNTIESMSRTMPEHLHKRGNL